jgi:hypothetical protein
VVVGSGYRKQKEHIAPPSVGGLVDPIFHPSNRNFAMLLVGFKNVDDFASVLWVFCFEQRAVDVAHPTAIANHVVTSDSWLVDRLHRAQRSG